MLQSSSALPRTASIPRQMGGRAASVPSPISTLATPRSLFRARPKLVPVKAGIDAPIAVAIVVFGVLIVIAPSLLPGLTSTI
jgi:hypothetical protein